MNNQQLQLLPTTKMILTATTSKKLNRAWCLVIGSRCFMLGAGLRRTTKIQKKLKNFSMLFKAFLSKFLEGFWR